MRTIAVGFQVDSLREACEANMCLGRGAAAGITKQLSIAYPVGEATLQLSGIHLRLRPKGKEGGKGRTEQHRLATRVPPSSAVPDTDEGGMIAADVVVQAHVHGEFGAAPQSYVVAVIPIRYDSTAGAHPSGVSSGTSSPEAATSSSTAYDKRVLNAQARLARRGPVAPAFASSFAKIDLRTQVERVRLDFTVMPRGRNSSATAGAAHLHNGKRSRAETSPEAGNAASPQRFDCALDVTVVGTVSALM